MSGTASMLRRDWLEVDSKLIGGTMLRVRRPGLRALGVPEHDPSMSTLALSAGSAASLREQPRD
jgi:hypothetical protein